MKKMKVTSNGDKKKNPKMYFFFPFLSTCALRVFVHTPQPLSSEVTNSFSVIVLLCSFLLSALRDSLMNMFSEDGKRLLVTDTDCVGLIPYQQVQLPWADGGFFSLIVTVSFDKRPRPNCSTAVRVWSHCSTFCAGISINIKMYFVLLKPHLPNDPT